MSLAVLETLLQQKTKQGLRDLPTEMAVVLL